jgi:hypothetical protein
MGTAAKGRKGDEPDDFCGIHACMRYLQGKLQTGAQPSTRALHGNKQ